MQQPGLTYSLQVPAGRQAHYWTTYYLLTYYRCRWAAWLTTGLGTTYLLNTGAGGPPGSALRTGAARVPRVLACQQVYIDTCTYMYSTPACTRLPAPVTTGRGHRRNPWHGAAASGTPGHSLCRARLHTGAASLTYGCRPVVTTVAYGCSLSHLRLQARRFSGCIRLQPLSPTVAGPSRFRRTLTSCS